MIITKSKFKEMFGYKDLSSISRLIRKETIVANDAGMIDLDDNKNKKWIKQREIEMNKNSIPADKKEQTPETQATAKTQKNESQLGIEINLLNEKLIEKQRKTTLLDLKIAKEKKELFEIEVVNKAMANIFDSLSQNLPEIPAIYADDIINIIKSDKNPKENIVKFLTDKIISQIRSSLENAENTTRKYYEET